MKLKTYIFFKTQMKEKFYVFLYPCNPYKRKTHIILNNMKITNWILFGLKKKKMNIF